MQEDRADLRDQTSSSLTRSETTKPRALLRCDGGVGVGLGHIMRCLALAEALSKAGWICQFAVSQESTRLAALASAPFQVHGLEHALSPQELFAIKNEPPDLLVIDHYEIDKDFETACNEWAAKVLILDDLPGRSHVADLLLDSAIDRGSSDYLGYVPDTCRLLLGPQFALIRSEITGRRKSMTERRQVRKNCRRLFLSFGGADRRGLGLQVLEGLESFEKRLTIDVAISGSSMHVEALEASAYASNHDITIHLDSDEIGELLEAADLAVGAAGVSAWERCVLGVPSVIVCAADNQRGTYEALIKAGAAYGVGAPDIQFAERIKTAVSKLDLNSEERSTISQRATQCCDGLGAQRVAAAIEEIVTKGRTHGSSDLSSGCVASRS